MVAMLFEFTRAWISLFSHSCKARVAWKEQTQIAMKTHSATRWWPKFEVIKQVFELFGDVEICLRHHDDLAPSTRAKLLTFLGDPRKKVHLQLELATLVDAALLFFQAIYKLEGDGALVFDCYDTISSLTTAMQVEHYPNVEEVAQRISQAHSYSKQQLIAHSKQCIQPAYQSVLHQSPPGMLERTSRCLQGCLFACSSKNTRITAECKHC